jgi:DNA-binding transcriptional ArsR family regulator
MSLERSDSSNITGDSTMGGRPDDEGDSVIRSPIGDVEGAAERDRYIDDVGHYFESAGIPRMAGRMIGTLMFADPPEMTAEDLARALHASRGSISTASRLLVVSGLVERRRRRGERRDYFAVRPGAWTDSVERRVDQIVALRRLAERGLDLAGDAPSRRRDSLVELADICLYFEREWPAVVDRWRRDRSARPA